MQKVQRRNYVRVNLIKYAVYKREDDEEKYSLVGKVVRCDRCKDRDYIWGVEFSELDEKDRDRIIKKVFTVMRKQRKLI
jgi:c-di-GMP-binding flagellar brake protein YcgR